MTDKSREQPSKTDWSLEESRMKPKVPRPSWVGGDAYPPERGELVPAESLVAPVTTALMPDTDASRGFLMQYKMGQIDRKALLQALQAHHDAQLDKLRYRLKKDVAVSNAAADRTAEEFLKNLDSEHLRILKELGLRNTETRADGLIEVRAVIVAKFREVKTKDWPQPFRERMVDDLMELEKRACNEMMKELGG